ncbi:tetratricopeptide repeat protein [Solidesulfovibrio sp.]|uniref:tetratricopeptide repeat protein n=1 Tax=Solidesulfovibrio sp. TaxID=2910990 RepID=UPI00262E0B5A|nr:tetratricopeptide repeat protein [Solidesulfovibrio sp.]
MNILEQIAATEQLFSKGKIEEAMLVYDDMSRMEHLTAQEKGLVLFGLGACHLVQNDYENACSRLKESWELLLSALGAKNPSTTRTMVLLSRALIAVGSLESGMEIGRGALENLVALYGPEDAQTATAAFFLSAGAYKFGRLAEAESLTLQAMGAWEKKHGHDSLQVATCLDALGKLRDVCGEKREGVRFHRQALDIKLKILGDHETTAASLGHAGVALAELGDWKEAATLLTRALETFRRIGAAEDAAGTALFREKLALCRQMLSKEIRDGQETAH